MNILLLLNLSKSRNYITCKYLVLYCWPRRCTLLNIWKRSSLLSEFILVTDSTSLADSSKSKAEEFDGVENCGERNDASLACELMDEDLDLGIGSRPGTSPYEEWNEVSADEFKSRNDPDRCDPLKSASYRDVFCLEELLLPSWWQNSWTVKLDTNTSFDIRTL